MGNNPGTRWLTNAEYTLPEQNLLAAVVHKAIRDAQSSAAVIRADAIRYLASANFETDCAWLNLDPARVRDLSRLQTEVKQP